MRDQFDWVFAGGVAGTTFAILAVVAVAVDRASRRCICCSRMFETRQRRRQHEKIGHSL